MVTDYLSASKYLSQVNPSDRLIFCHVSFLFISLWGGREANGDEQRGRETGRIGEGYGRRKGKRREAGDVAGVMRGR